MSAPTQNRTEAQSTGGVSPGRLLLIAGLACALVCAAAVLSRAGQRGLGLGLEGDATASVVRIVSASGPAANVPVSSVLLSIGAPGADPLPVGPSDVIEEPDFFDEYRDMDAFFRRQTAFAEVLRGDEVIALVKRGDDPPEPFRIRPAPPPWRSLPGVFWFQVVAGAAAFLVSVWVLVLRPRDLGVRLFAVMGAAIAGFTIPAAIYGTRELAMPGATMWILSAVNHATANVFGCALVAFFLVFPARLVRRTRLLWLVPAVFMSWVVLDLTRIAPNQNWGARMPIMLEMIGAIVLAVVQLRATRGDPRGRALLRWLGVSILVGAGLVVFSIVGSTVIGWFPPLKQGYSFGFFLLMHVSFALGLRRHRLFDLDEWAYLVLFWVLAGLAVVALDVVLVAVLDANRALTTWAALLVCGFLYVPLRSWLWSKATSRKTIPEHEIFEAVLQVTFAADDAERSRLWNTLLAKLFDPLEFRPLDEAVDRAAVRDDGIRLDVPAAAGAPAQRLDYPWRGRGLFGQRHERLAEQLVSLVRHAESRREAFERGVRDERGRIARDMHDDIGAGLLTSLYREDLEATRESIRQAIGDVRSIVHELTFRRLAFADVVAEIRTETLRRLHDAKIEVEWPAPVVPDELVINHAVYRHLTSMLRELTSNVIKHSGAKQVHIRLETHGERLAVTYADDGRGFDPATAKRGWGLDNLERRASNVGGTVTWHREEDETVVRIDMPVSAERVRAS